MKNDFMKILESFVFNQIDEDFLQALEYGMGKAAGNALGVDRLIMLICGTNDIRDTCWAPIL